MPANSNTALNQWCYVRAERGTVVFQLDLLNLLRDPESTFHALRSRSATSRGFSPQDPLVLNTVTEAQCRAFHGVVNAGPLDLHTTLAHPSALRWMLDAGFFAHAHGLRLFRTFALVKIKEMDPAYFTASLTAGRAAREDLLLLTWLCGPARYNDPEKAEAAVRGAVRESWLVDIERQRGGTLGELREVLDVAAEYDFRALLGDVYCLYLVRLVRMQAEALAEGTGTAAAFVFPDTELSALHRRRMRAGYMSLHLCWARFAATPIPLDEYTNTAHESASDMELHQMCGEEWARCWHAAAQDSAVQRIEGVDIVRKMEVFRGTVNAFYG
ncbi:hypothetical protein C8R46DRAFT_1208734 [Mycena filopes]|nr:hypothetical protein C8R46DRAFT_1208734 [Mycena filopes]